jgi:hypothetical protein
MAPRQKPSPKAAKPAAVTPAPVSAPSPAVAPAPEVLSLAEAVLRWSDAAVVEEVRARERRYSAHHLQAFYRQTEGFCRQLIATHEAHQPNGSSWMAGPPSYEDLLAAWSALETDFRQRLLTTIFLEGLQTRPAREEQRQLIPQEWAADAAFDLARGVIEVDDMRFAGVTASLSRPAQIAANTSASASDRSIPPITEDNVRDLTDDEVLLLLEDHARRVLASDDAELITPGRVSVMPLIKRKMQARATSGELLRSIGTETRVLADWISTRVPSHQVPTSKAIANTLRGDYAVLTARSNGIMA